MIKRRLALAIICLVLASCQAGNSERSDTVAQLAARTEMLAETTPSFAKQQDDGDDPQFENKRKEYVCNELPVILLPRQHDERNLTIGHNDGRAGDNNGPSMQGYPDQGNPGVGNLEISPLRKAIAEDLDQLIVFYHES